MSRVDENQPLGTPTWMELPVADRPAAQAYYGAVFGWRFEPAEYGTACLIDGLPVAALRHGDGPGWDVYLAADDCDRVTERILAAGGTVVQAPTEIGDSARVAMVLDPTGARVGIWQGRTHPGCRLVNQPDTLVRNDLVTAAPGDARAFYTRVFGFTLDGNDDMPGLDFTFLRRPDGHEIGGIVGVADPPASAWATTFEVANTDATVAKAAAAGGTNTEPDETPYGRSATLTDPFGNEFGIIARP